MEIDYDYLRTGTAIGFRGSHELCSNYLFLFTAELTVFDNAVYRLSISLCSSETFALKVESCR